MLSKTDTQSVGLTLSPGLSFSEWSEVGKSLSFGHGMHQWWIGDWLNYGEESFGEKCHEIAGITKYKKGYLAGLKSVSKAVPLALRCANLKWGHHKEVAILETDEDKKVALHWAESEKVSVKKFREQIIEWRGGNPRPRKEKMSYGDTPESTTEHDRIADVLYTTLIHKSYDTGSVCWAAFRGMARVDDRYRVVLYLSKSEIENLPRRWRRDNERAAS